MKHLIEAVIEPFKMLGYMYRPVPYSGFGGNFSCAIGSLVFLPRIFISPVLFAIVMFLKKPCPDRIGVLIIAFLHLSAMPLMVIYFIALPFLGCRIYLHTPAARALVDIERQIKAQQEADAG